MLNTENGSTTASQQVKRLCRAAESGNQDGAFSDVMYMPILIALLLFGLVMAMVGFWRIGASYATQRGAQVGAVAPDNGSAAQSSAWQGWTNSTTAPGNYVVDPQIRSSHASMNTFVIFEYMGLGPWQFSISAQTRSRAERFYPGAPVCTISGCDD